MGLLCNPQCACRESHSEGGLPSRETRSPAVKKESSEWQSAECTRVNLPCTIKYATHSTEVRSAFPAAVVEQQFGTTHIMPYCHTTLQTYTTLHNKSYHKYTTTAPQLNYTTPHHTAILNVNCQRLPYQCQLHHSCTSLHHTAIPVSSARDITWSS